MTKVVLKLIPLILERIEGFVFDFPACPSPAHQVICVVPADGEVGDPAKMAGFFAFDLPVFQKVDAHIGIRLVQRHIIEKTKAVDDPIRSNSNSVVRPSAWA